MQRAPSELNSSSGLGWQALLLANVRDAIVATDLEGIVTYWNSGATVLFGWEAEEMLGRPLIERVPEAARGQMRAAFESILLGNSWTGEWLDYRKDGSRVWIDAHVYVFTDGEGHPAGVIGLSYDISERKRVEAALVESEDRLRAIVEHSPSVIFLKDLEGRYLLMNHHHHTRLAGEPVEKVLGRTDVELFSAEVAARIQEHDRKLLERGGSANFEEATEGGERQFISQKFLLRQPDGTPYAIGGVSTEITDFKRLQAALIQQSQALTEADRRKDEFLAMLAHELRNPLAPILNAVQIMRARPERTRGEWARDIVERQVLHLSRLIDDLLDVSRITHGKITLHSQRVNLALILESALESTRPLLEERGHTVCLSLPDEPVGVLGDPARLEQILVNLITNAAKYTKTAGHIWITLAREAEESVIRVRDNGVGITPDLLPHIFDLFTRAEQGSDRAQGGLGIGLSLVKRLLEQHGGTVTAASAGARAGSEFTVRLPFELPHPDTALADTALPKPPALPAARSPLQRVLVVEDNMNAAQTLVELLELWNYEAKAVYTGTEAVSAARAFRPEAVLLDIGLPGMDGYEVAEHLRAEPGGPRTYLIALTGYGQEEDRQRALAAGFNVHLVKPVNLDQLRQILASIEVS